MNIWQELWDYRGFIKGSVKREFQLKYQKSMLGAAWNIINPLAMIIVYTVVFSKVMQARLPGAGGTFSYSIFLCSGVLAWGLFTEVTLRAQNVFIDNANLIKKLSFPRITLPIIVLASALINFAIGFSLFVGFLLLSGNFPGWSFLAVIPVLGLQLFMAIGLGVILGVLNVFFRDVGQLYGVVLQFWFWFTPIVYSPAILPERLKTWLCLNPLAAIMNAYQGIFVEGLAPQWGSLIYPALLGIIFCLCGLRLYRRCSGDMVDEL
ncbi:MAG TPA: ABC transporter permease [Proteobacteria bacterium]|nr:ABC transporter permease [Pseudomonadota bacterium]